MTYGAASFTERRQAVDTAADALRGLRDVLMACPNEELGRLAGELAEVRALAGAGLVAVVAEADGRGIIAESQCASTRGWIAEYAWHSRREATTVTKSAALLGRADMAPVADAVADTDLDLSTAVTVGGEYDKLAPDLKPEARPVVLENMVDIGCEHGPTGVRKLKEHLLARYGAEGVFEDFEEHCRKHVDLSAGHQTKAGLWDYRLTLDNESHAVLEAAIGPLSAPKPDRDTGTPDPRPAGRRRGQALITTLRRAQSAAKHVPTSAKATVMVTVDYQQLAGRLAGRRAEQRAEQCADGDSPGSSTGAAGNAATDTAPDSGPHDDDAADGDINAAAMSGLGYAMGTIAAGTLLSPATVRRMACDAAIIPAVLGSRGEILDQGRVERLFTAGQVRALWARDRHCSFDGCDTPAAWCDAHHLVHWAHGGESTLDNAALLCPRHHSIVHRDELAGRVRDGTITNSTITNGMVTNGMVPNGMVINGNMHDRRVVWDRRPGSYWYQLHRPGAPPASGPPASAHPPAHPAAA